MHSMLLTILGLLVVAYLPGAVMFRAPVLDRPRRAALDPEERVFWSACLSIASSSLIVLALAASGRYTFGRLLLADAAVAACPALLFRRRLLYQRAAAPAPSLGKPSSEDVRSLGLSGFRTSFLLPLALVVLGCWLFFPPFEHVAGGQDPGVYVNEGVALAQRGSLIFREDVVASMPAAVRDLFFPSHHNGNYYSLRFMGFFVVDPDRGTVVGQFPHLYPAWIAIGYGVAGLRGALCTTPVAAILGLLAVYFAGARLLGRWPALAAALLLALNVATTWFAREPNSDVVAQALVVAALLAYARAHVDGDRFFAPVAAVLLGLMLFLRIDSVLALAGVGAAVILHVLDGKRPRLLFLLPSLALVAVGWFYLRTVLPMYSGRPIAFAQNLQPLARALLAGGLVGLVALVLAARVDRIAAPLRWAVPRLLATVLVTAAVYAYFFRAPAQVPGGIAWHDARSLETFTWYFPPIALALSVAGYVLVSWRSFWRDPALMLTLTAYSLFLFYKTQIVPDHFWAARRFVPMILPGACLMASAAACALVGAARRPNVFARAAGALGLALLAVIGVQLVRADLPVVRHVQHAGIVSRLDTLAGRFSPDDLLIVNPRDVSTDLHVVAPALNYIWNRTSLVLPSPKPDKRAFAAFLAWARSRYHNVYFLGGGGTDLVSTAIAAEPVFSDRFQVPEYESRRNAYPRVVKRKEFDFGVYRFTNPAAQPDAFVLDVGTLDDLNVVRFHAKERSDGLNFRWTRDASYIALPRMDRARTLTLWMDAGGRPAKAAAAHVTIYWNDALLGETAVTAGLNAYQFAIVAPAARPASLPEEGATVKIVSNTWKPRQLLGVEDDRDLGVRVHRVEVR